MCGGILGMSMNQDLKYEKPWSRTINLVSLSFSYLGCRPIILWLFLFPRWEGNGLGLRHHVFIMRDGVKGIGCDVIILPLRPGNDWASYFWANYVCIYLKAISTANRPSTLGVFKIRTSLYTCVSAFVEILQSLQCKIFQYTFLGQYPMKFWDSFSLCKNQQPAWLQLDHKKFRPSEVRFSGAPLYHETEKTRSHVRYTSLKNIDEGTYWIRNLSIWIRKVTLVFTNF